MDGRRDIQALIPAGASKKPAPFPRSGLGSSVTWNIRVKGRLSLFFHFMNVVELRGLPRRGTRPSRAFSFFVCAMMAWAGPLVAVAAEQGTAAVDDAADDDAIVSLAAYNVKADRIEDFGLRVRGTVVSGHPNAVTIWFTKFSPLITAVVPNTAAAKAGLQPGERILKSEGQSTVGGPFSTGKFGQWQKTQKKKWAEVAAGKKNVTWTLEVENPVTKAVRTVKLVVPSPPPYWGASVWRAPEGRQPSTVAESGPLAERSRAVLDNGIWTLLDRDLLRTFAGESVMSGPTPTGYHWQLNGDGAGDHRILATQFRGRTEVVLEASSRATGRWVYLTSPSGALERAWHWQRKSKGKSGEATLEEARAGFEHELDLWTTKVAKVSARWPFELKPGYDANAIFAILAAKDGAPPVEVVRPFAGEFMKLRPASDAERTMFTEAYGKVGVERDYWAYTETTRGLEDKRVLVTRVDPSQPEAGRCVLLSIDGKPPTPADIQRWRDEGGDTPKPLGDLPPLAGLVDLKDLRIFKDEIASVVFELPIRGGNGDFPTEKFQALFRVNKTNRSFEDIAVKLRDSIRVAGVVKITEAGMEMQFQTFDPSLAPQPVRLKAGGGARVLLVKFSRSFEATRTDFKRVMPFDETAVAEK
jgi:hypothetical protein